MPELPEVETVCQGIRPHLLGLRIKKIIVREKRLRWPIPTRQLQQALTQQPITDVSRRAKYILLKSLQGHCVIHLGMSGSLRIVAPDTPLRPHDHVDYVLSSGNILRFNDPRRFGAILWASTLDTLPQLTHLGPEPFDAAFHANYLYEITQKQRRAIKVLLMDPKVVVGVGNIYASESLFAAKIHPQRPAHSLTFKECQHLCAAVRKILKMAIKQGGTTLKDFCQSDGKPGYFKVKLKVYDRADLPCTDCVAPIKVSRLGQRSTYYCSHCQK